MNTKTCYECKQTKLVSEFDTDIFNVNEYYVYCRSCRAKFKEQFDKRRKEYLERIS